MNRPTRQNFYPGGNKGDEVSDLRRQLEKKEETMKVLQEKYDKLYIGTVLFIQLNRKKDKNVMLPVNEQSKRKFNNCSGNVKIKRKSLFKKKKVSNLRLRTSKNCPKKKTLN